LGGTTDLGAIVTDNQGHYLSYRTFINGALRKHSGWHFRKWRL